MAQLLAVAGTEKDYTIKVNGKSRSYKLYVPSNVKENCPFVLSLHGSNGSANDRAPFGEDVADYAGCIVAYPSGLMTPFPIGFGGSTTGWTASGEFNDDVQFFLDLIDDVASRHKIDRKRLYCCGFSNGGMMTYAMSCVCSDVFAAFASISGFQLNEFHLRLTGKRPVPFLHIHGKSDNFVLYELMPKIVCQMVMRNGANPVPVKTVKNGKYTKSVYEATEGGFPYIYYEMDGMGHSPYTGNTEEGNSGKTMWNFFKQYTLDSPRDTTLKWRPAIETEGYVAKNYGVTMNSSSYLFYFGETPQIPGNGGNDKENKYHNVYRTLQFVNGKYKFCFKAQGDADKTIAVTLQKLPASGTKGIILTTTVNAGKEYELPFEVKDGWGEYRLTMKRANNKDEITLSGLAIHSVTAQEYDELMQATPVRQASVKATGTTRPSTRYALTGRQAASNSKGLVIENGRKVLR
jgi:poly(3-hydroxybutyrate) depolymerase